MRLFHISETDCGGLRREVALSGHKNVGLVEVSSRGTSNIPEYSHYIYIKFIHRTIFVHMNFLTIILCPMH